MTKGLFCLLVSRKVRQGDPFPLMLRGRNLRPLSTRKPLGGLVRTGAYLRCLSRK